LLISLVYLLFRRALAVSSLRLSPEFKELEIVVLRHERRSATPGWAAAAA
jgi:hypothetical protein